MIYLQLLGGVLLVALALFIATRITLATGWRDILAVHLVLAFVWGMGWTAKKSSSDEAGQDLRVSAVSPRDFGGLRVTRYAMVSGVGA